MLLPMLIKNANRKGESLYKNLQIDRWRFSTFSHILFGGQGSTMLCSVWDRRSLTGDWTQAPCIWSTVLTREVLLFIYSRRWFSENFNPPLYPHQIHTLEVTVITSVFWRHPVDTCPGTSLMWPPSVSSWALPQQAQRSTAERTERETSYMWFPWAAVKSFPGKL